MTHQRQSDPKMPSSGQENWKKKRGWRPCWEKWIWKYYTWFFVLLTHRSRYTIGGNWRYWRVTMKRMSFPQTGLKMPGSWWRTWPAFSSSRRPAAPGQSSAYFTIALFMDPLDLTSNFCYVFLFCFSCFLVTINILHKFHAISSFLLSHFTIFSFAYFFTWWNPKMKRKRRKGGGEDDDESTHHVHLQRNGTMARASARFVSHGIGMKIQPPNNKPHANHRAHHYTTPKNAIYAQHSEKSSRQAVAQVTPLDGFRTSPT